MAHIGLFHFPSSFSLTVHISLVPVQMFSSFLFHFHWDILFCGRHQGVPFSWRCLIGLFSWRCCEAFFSHESQRESFSLAHQSVLFPWRSFDGPQYWMPWASTHPWRSLNEPCSSALSFSCLRFQAETPAFGTTILLLLILLALSCGWIEYCEWVRFMYFLWVLRVADRLKDEIDRLLLGVGDGWRRWRWRIFLLQNTALHISSWL